MIMEWALLIVSVLTLLCDIAIFGILVVEYYYDKKIYDKKLNRAIEKKSNTVIVEVENGQATVRHKPKNISVVINNKSEEMVKDEIPGTEPI
jgi:hypothetical protein